jgi:RNA polymerase sigma factor (sigma-70 family)
MPRPGELQHEKYQPVTPLSSRARRLVEEHVGLVGLHLRTRITRPEGVRADKEVDDLFQEGYVALIRAAGRYNPRRHGRFQPYALARIRGAVHRALREKFTLIHVTQRAAERVRAGRAGLGWATQRPVPLADFDPPVCDAAPPIDGEHEPIRHCVHRRFQCAVQRALTAVSQGRPPGAVAVYRRLARERLLISSELERTPLRVVARDTGLSSGRVAAYEKRLLERTRTEFARDPQVRLLVRFAAQDARGLDGMLDSRQHRELEAAVAGV